MNDRLQLVSTWAAEHHEIVSGEQLTAFGVTSSLRYQWVSRGLLQRVGHGSFRWACAPTTWESSLAAGLADLRGIGLVGGRAAARQLGLDSFAMAPAEVVVARSGRHRAPSVLVRSTDWPFAVGDVVTINGLRTTSAMRTILDGPLFGFSRLEMENAIDSALRLRLLSEQRLRARAWAQHSRGINGSRLLLDALIDSGGESQLERRFLALLRANSIQRPVTQKIFRDGNRTVARVDAYFPGDLVVEVAGHGTHASSSQRQADAQRQVELTLRGLRILLLTYEDVTFRPAWVAGIIARALAQAA